jgi:hypothetical protein
LHKIYIFRSELIHIQIHKTAKMYDSGAFTLTEHFFRRGTLCGIL